MSERLVADARAVWEAAVAAVLPSRLLEGVDLDAHLRRPLAEYRRVAIFGAGKAALAMAGALEVRLSRRPDTGLVVVPRGYRETLPPSERAPERVGIVEAGHPVPDAAGERAARQTLALAEGLEEKDLLIALVSGGGSALWPLFAEGIALADAQATFRLLLTSGADIHAVNAVRKRLSRIGGGRLAAAAHPAETLALVLSDVPGDDPTTIASGPTVPDPTTTADAHAVLRRFGLWERVPASVRHRLQQPDAETPKPGDPRLSRARTALVGSNRDALAAAQAEAERRGYVVDLGAEPVTGEARGVGWGLARAALDAEAGRPRCLLRGGETTVTVTGAGRGGRNQEVALAAALELDGAGRAAVVLSGGTDGVDGRTDAAGAWATPETARRARALGLDPERHLAENDAYPFFDALGGLLRTGPTHTNVTDVLVALGRG